MQFGHGLPHGLEPVQKSQCPRGQSSDRSRRSVLAILVVRPLDTRTGGTREMAGLSGGQSGESRSMPTVGGLSVSEVAGGLSRSLVVRGLLTRRSPATAVTETVAPRREGQASSGQRRTVPGRCDTSGKIQSRWLCRRGSDGKPTDHALPTRHTPPSLLRKMK